VRRNRFLAWKWEAACATGGIYELLFHGLGRGHVQSMRAASAAAEYTKCKLIGQTFIGISVLVSKGHGKMPTILLLLLLLVRKRGITSCHLLTAVV
jgi:hypothetical protein